jgi:hypothetical protein
MMGGFQSNSRRGQTGSAAAPWLLAGLLLAGPAASGQPGERPVETPGPPAAGAAREVDDTGAMEARVSTSPESDSAQARATTDPSATARPADDPPPLTRAAARRRVETISPVPWLARFGPVSLERRE